MKLNGTVSSYNDSRGYGFIQIDDEDSIAFVHYTAILSDSYKTLSQGDRVSFRLIDGPINKIALDVKKIY